MYFLDVITCTSQPSDALNLIRKFSINQDEDIWNQLLYGIRYLDIRVGYYPNTPEKFWAVHDFIKVSMTSVVEYTYSLINVDSFYANFTNTTFQKICIPHLTRTMKGKKTIRILCTQY